MSNFLTTDIFPGLLGVNLFSAIDSVEATQLVNMTNVDRNEEGEITGRRGLTTVLTTATTPSRLHFITKQEIPTTFASGESYDYIYLADGSLYSSIDEGTPVLLATGFSYPTVALQYHPVGSGSPWIILVSEDKMGKVQVGTQVFAPLGLPAPGGTYAAFRIDEFDLTPAATLVAEDWAAYAFFGFNITNSTTPVASAFTSYATTISEDIETFESATGWVANAGTGAAPTTPPMLQTRRSALPP